MSNRLSVAHMVPRRDPHEFLPAPTRPRGLATTALRWLREVVASDEDLLSAAMRRDLGLPALSAMPFAYDAERSRVRV